MRRVLHLWCVLLLAASAAAAPQTTTQTSQEIHKLDVPGNQSWTDTGLDVHPGQTVTIAAAGNLHYMDGSAPGPEGSPRSWKDLLRSLPVNSAGRGALIGRIGSSDATQAFLVGAKLQFPVRVAGRLFLGINGPSGDSAEGNFQVTVTIPAVTPPPLAPASPVAGNSMANGTPGSAASTASTSSSSPTETATPSAPLPPDLLSQIPRRIADKDGNPGDMVNFLLIGSEDQVKAAFQAAGWVQVDRDTGNAVLQALVASLSKQAYLTMPMSQLYLFGRPQDYGFAHAEPLTVVTTRHHLRIWKSAFTVGGEPVWVGAATHDMGLERDQRNGKLTHHIDPNVDDERGFLGRSLSETGYVSQQAQILPSDPLKEAKTATGGSFHSNGEVLVLWLRGQ
jgi:LssY C-terminus